MTTYVSSITGDDDYKPNIALYTIEDPLETLYGGAIYYNKESDTSYYSNVLPCCV